METRLFIIGAVMLAWAITAKILKKKNLLENKFIFTALHVIFIATVTFLAFWLFDFVSNGGDVAMIEFSLTKTLIRAAIIIAFCIWGAVASFKGDGKKRIKIFAKDYEWADTIYFSALLAAFVMFFFVQAFKIPSASMRNTLIEGDHLFVNKAVYGFRIPLTSVRFGQFRDIKKGDVIIFAFPSTTKDQINCGGPQFGRDYVKRIIALPGDKVEIKGEQVFVNDIKQEHQSYEVFDATERYSFKNFEQQKEYQKKWEDMVLENYYGMLLRDQFGPVIVPEGHYFVMGDNRDYSCDSRFWGPVPRENIKGKVWFIHFPFSRARFIK
ncbi:Signal peptidase [Elusimicrobium minutum Pei191]|uniref:Signal peptidase I n=1 Tax=Elusimicrobium minutum (strain Pei191) TaxID=445932 RepID=B2KAN8_ELUMP|nr:signal peptidase I [Elusimicrobium minutum]ACC97584.1 Signal peptidase [Elusimicrobium minutum Pei191]